MRNPLPIAGLLVAIVIGCTGAAAPDPTPGPAAPFTPEGYTGPELAAKFDGSELHLVVQVKSGGYRLELRETGRASDHTFVKLCLTSPGDREVVTQALETKILRVRLMPETGPVHVRLQQIQRGVSYITDPEFEFAKVVPR